MVRQPICKRRSPETRDFAHTSHVGSDRTGRLIALTQTGSGTPEIPAQIGLR